jgi:hypothetical protein
MALCNRPTAIPSGLFSHLPELFTISELVLPFVCNAFVCTAGFKRPTTIPTGLPEPLTISELVLPFFCTALDLYCWFQQAHCHPDWLVHTPARVPHHLRTCTAFVCTALHLYCWHQQAHCHPHWPVHTPARAHYDITTRDVFKLKHCTLIVFAGLLVTACFPARDSAMSACADNPKPKAAASSLPFMIVLSMLLLLHYYTCRGCGDHFAATGPLPSPLACSHTYQSSSPYQNWRCSGSSCCSSNSSASRPSAAAR